MVLGPISVVAEEVSKHISSICIMVLSSISSSFSCHHSLKNCNVNIMPFLKLFIKTLLVSVMGGHHCFCHKLCAAVQAIG